MKKIILLLTLMFTGTLVMAQNHAAAAISLPKTPSPKGAKVYIQSPSNGETVPSTFIVKFGLQGMGVAPAGIQFEGTGHHHLLVNMEKVPDLNMPLPANENSIHFGKGQTETKLTLPPGEHTLQLVLGDYLHIAHSPPVISKKITVTVAE